MCPGREVTWGDTARCKPSYWHPEPLVVNHRRRLPTELSADCIFVEETGECGERQLNHSDDEAERF